MESKVHSAAQAEFSEGKRLARPAMVEWVYLMIVVALCLMVGLVLPYASGQSGEYPLWIFLGIGSLVVLARHIHLRSQFRLAVERGIEADFDGRQLRWRIGGDPTESAEINDVLEGRVGERVAVLWMSRVPTWLMSTSFRDETEWEAFRNAVREVCERRYRHKRIWLGATAFGWIVLLALLVAAWEALRHAG